MNSAATISAAKSANLLRLAFANSPTLSLSKTTFLLELSLINKNRSLDLPEVHA